MSATSTKDNFLDDIVPRAAGILAAFIVTWAAGKRVTLDANQVAALFVSLYAVVHRALAAKRDSLRAKRALRQRSIAAEYDYTRRRDS